MVRKHLVDNVHVGPFYLLPDVTSFISQAPVTDHAPLKQQALLSVN